MHDDGPDLGHHWPAGQRCVSVCSGPVARDLPTLPCMGRPRRSLPPSGGQLAVFPLISRWSALGNSVFMLSDTLLALDKFVSPLPYAGLWVLASYYVAQGLIVRGVSRTSNN